MSSVGVIMAAYNVRPYVASAVRSILEQSMRDLELIVVNDGSTDGTETVLAKIQDPRLRVIRTENRGVCRARNRALREVASPYVAVMDADDISHPERLARQLRHMEDCPDLAGVGCGVWLMTPRGRRVYEDRCPHGVQSVLGELYANGGGLYPATCMMRTDLVRKAGGYRQEIPVSEDLDLLLRMSAYGGLDNVPLALYSYRLNSRSLTFSSKARRDYYASVALKLWAERKETGTDSVDRGLSVEPFVRGTGAAGKEERPYTVDSVLAYMYRQDAVERAGSGQLMAVVARLLMSLGHAPTDRRTWKTLAKVLLGRQKPLRELGP